MVEGLVACLQKGALQEQLHERALIAEQDAKHLKQDLEKTTIELKRLQSEAASGRAQKDQKIKQLEREVGASTAEIDALTWKLDPKQNSWGPDHPNASVAKVLRRMTSTNT